ncbi:MAG: CHAD domain-containing protein [Rhodanobacter sp.]
MNDRRDRSHPAATVAVGESLRMRTANTLAQAIHVLGWRGARLHAGVHQARKLSRQTRAVLALGGSTLGPDGVLIDRQLRRINRGLSGLRDAPALVETLDRLAKKHAAAATGPLLDRARRVLQQQRALDELSAVQKAHIDRDKTLTALLGEAQDYALLLDHCDEPSPFAQADRKALHSLAKTGARRVRARIAQGRLD